MITEPVNLNYEFRQACENMDIRLDDRPEIIREALRTDYGKVALKQKTLGASSCVLIGLCEAAIAEVEDD